MKALWDSISSVGVRPGMEDQHRRAVLLTNRLTLILLFLNTIAAFARIQVYAWDLVTALILHNNLFYVLVLYINLRGHTTAGRLLLSWYLPLSTLALTIIDKTSAVQPEEVTYFTSRVVLLFSVMIPLMIFRLKDGRYLYLALTASALSLLFYYPLHHLMGVSYYQQGYNAAGFLYFNFITFLLYVLLVSSFLYYKKQLENTELELWQRNQQLEHLYTELGIQHEEIHAQAEKLSENQQALQEANQLIAQQKVILEEENTQLHRHLLEKNKILEESNRELHNRLEELKHFSYTISHNLRGPVASLLGLSSLYKLEEADPHNRELMQHTKTSAQALDMVIRDLSQVLQLREGKVMTETIDIADLLQTVLVSLRQEKEACQAVIYQQLAIKELVGVKSYLHSILYNLLSNALKYRAPERDCIITISSRQADGGILIEVADNGTGIDLQQHGHQIFKMYKRFHENRGGRGLGLYLLKVQAEVMDGYVEVHSQPGKGSTFSVWLPQQGMAQQGLLQQRVPQQGMPRQEG